MSLLSSSLLVSRVLGTHCLPSISLTLSRLWDAHCLPTISFMFSRLWGTHSLPTIFLMLSHVQDTRYLLAKCHLDEKSAMLGFLHQNLESPLLYGEFRLGWLIMSCTVTSSVGSREKLRRTQGG